MQIVQVTSAPGQGQYHVVLDNGDYLHVPSSVYFSCRLFPDRQLDDQELTAIRWRCNYQAAKEKALNWLKYGDRSRGECRLRLEKDFPTEVVEAVVSELTRLQLIDDQRVAQHAIERCQQRGWGKKRMAFELHRKGFDAQQITEACAELGAENELESALTWLSRQLRNKDIQDLALQRRLLAALLRRGFGFAIAQQAMRRVTADFIDDRGEL